MEDAVNMPYLSWNSDPRTPPHTDATDAMIDTMAKKNVTRSRSAQTDS